MLSWVLCAFATLLLCLPASEASADKVRTLSSKLERSHSSKVRISAALSLAKLDDKRAIRALGKALRDDSAANIRRICAASLGQRLATLKGKLRNETVSLLRDAASKDKDKDVRGSAEVALAKALNGKPAGDSDKAGKNTGLLVGVSAPGKRNRNVPAKTASLLQSTVKQVIRDKAPANIQTAPGTGMPSNLQLKQKGLAGYSIVPDVSKLKMIRRGRQVLVQCEVSLRLSPWAGEGEVWVADKTATVTGSGTVTSGNSSKAIADSSEECLVAVVSQVTLNQVVPFLSAQAR